MIYKQKNPIFTREHTDCAAEHDFCFHITNLFTHFLFHFFQNNNTAVLLVVELYFFNNFFQ